MAYKPKLLTWTKDTTLPTLSSVTFVSNNADTTLAFPGDISTLSFTASEIITNILVTINGKNIIPIQTGLYTYTATYTSVVGDTEGEIPFTINFKDNYGNIGVEVIATTGGEIVSFDEAPVLSSAARTDDTTISITASELLDTATTTHANDGGFIVYETGTPATTYAVSGIAPGATDDLITLTVADISASIATGVTITYTAGVNGDIADVAGNPMVTDSTGVVIATWA